MKRFEIGNKYSNDNGVTVYEIIKRTAKFVTYNEILHYGRSNEKIATTKKAGIKEWDSREVFFGKMYATIESTQIYE